MCKTLSVVLAQPHQIATLPTAVITAEKDSLLFHGVGWSSKLQRTIREMRVLRVGVLCRSCRQ